MPTPGNSINEQTTGISGFTGTAFNGSPATQHCVQVGGSTTSTLTSIPNGTTGQFLGANTGADPSFQTPTFLTVTKVLTSTQIKNLNGTPITLLAAQGTGKAIIPFSIMCKLTYGGTNPFTSTETVNIQYQNGSGGLIYEDIFQSSTTFLTDSSSSYATDVDAAFGSAAFPFEIANVENQPLVVYNPGSEITGNAANNNTITIVLCYYVITI